MEFKINFAKNTIIITKGGNLAELFKRLEDLLGDFVGWELKVESQSIFMLPSLTGVRNEDDIENKEDDFE